MSDDSLDRAGAADDQFLFGAELIIVFLLFGWPLVFCFACAVPRPPIQCFCIPGVIRIFRQRSLRLPRFCLSGFVGLSEGSRCGLATWFLEVLGSWSNNNTFTGRSCFFGFAAFGGKAKYAIFSMEMCGFLALVPQASLHRLAVGPLRVPLGFCRCLSVGCCRWLFGVVSLSVLSSVLLSALLGGTFCKCAANSCY